MQPARIRLPGTKEMAESFAREFGMKELNDEKVFYYTLLDNAGKEVCDQDIVMMVTMALGKHKKMAINLTHHIDALVGKEYIKHDVVLAAKQILENVAKIAVAKLTAN